jgi:hypothetical protein
VRDPAPARSFIERRCVHAAVPQPTRAGVRLTKLPPVPHPARLTGVATK